MNANEPVAWRNLCVGNIGEDSEWIYNEIGQGEPLYTHPANKKVEKNTDLYEKVCNCTKKLDLTDEEIRVVWYGHPEFKDGLGVNPIPFARAILRKAQEK